MLLLYFTIYTNHICYVSKLLTLFHHTICMFMYPCVRSISPYFHMFMYPCLCSISPCCMLCVHVFTLFHHTNMFMYPSYWHYFTIQLCVYVSMFLYYFTIYINHICYVSILLTLFHHINCYMFMYPYIHVFAYEH